MLGQPAALLLAEPLDAARLADLALLEEPAGLDLAEAGERLQHGQHLHLAGHLVVLGLHEELLEGERPHLQALLELGSDTTREGGLLECGLALLGRQNWRERHGSDLRGSHAADSRAPPTRP